MSEISLIEKSTLKTHLTYFSLMCFFIVLLSSCGPSKAALAISQSYAYKVKLVHIENKNSTYDNLVSNYFETSKSPDQKFAEAFQKDTLIYMAKTPCLGRCPVYSITVYNSGNTKYEGTANIDMQGIFQSKLNENQTLKLKELMGKIDLLKMYNKYPRAVKIVGDVQSTKLLISDGSLKFPTEISYGEPEELANVQLYLDQLISELSWVQI